MHFGRSEWMDWRADITDTFGIPGENDNGRRVVEICAKKGTV